MDVTIKVCGLSTVQAIDAAQAAGADLLGFVFFEKSPRHLALDAARSLGMRTAAAARKVALTVDADDPYLAAIVETLSPGMLQLHGSESPARVAQVRARFGLPVIKVVPVAVKADLRPVAAYAEVADMLLFDAKPHPGADRPGGNGARFDWHVLGSLGLRVPWLLAGGIDASNVEAALAATGAPGVDVSSGVESAPGSKDAAKIAAFVATARAAAARLGRGLETV